MDIMDSFLKRREIGEHFEVQKLETNVGSHPKDQISTDKKIHSVQDFSNDLHS